ncbi:MAG: DUF4956 domain-containing protein [Lachnospiraceae bacterium]|nr:DUF4956 domain-containing protein [Lachnospiraceae bacterium]
MLLFTFLLSLYEFLVYRYVSHRAFYNKSFNIAVAIIPLFIATIILCLQSNIVITLGTIGALAIIRFRTAIKDPVDMLYILWSIHTGIVCGCQLYEVGVLTSLAVTIVLLLLDNINFGRKPCVLIVHCADENEKILLEAIGSCTKSYKIKSSNYTTKGIDYVIELSIKNNEELVKELKNIGIEQFSILEYDSDDVI